MDYHKKYRKYKMKYALLKNELNIGGAEMSNEKEKNYLYNIANPLKTSVKFNEIFWRPEFNDSKTGNENISFISKLYGKSELLVLDVLKKVGLGKLENKLVKFYSQGMLQRLKLATAIILNPEIILLDEPLNGLDNEGLDLFKKVYTEWEENSKTIFVVSHDQEWLKNFTSRTIELT